MPDDGDDFVFDLVVCLLVGICFLYCLLASLAVHLLFAMSSALACISTADRAFYDGTYAVDDHNEFRLDLGDIHGTLSSWILSHDMNTITNDDQPT